MCTDILVSRLLCPRLALRVVLVCLAKGNTSSFKFTFTHAHTRDNLFEQCRILYLSVWLRATPVASSSNSHTHTRTHTTRETLAWSTLARKSNASHRQQQHRNEQLHYLPHKVRIPIRRMLLRFVLSSKHRIRWMLSCSTPLTCSTKANHKNNMHELCLCYTSTKNEIQIAYTCLLAVARHASAEWLWGGLGPPHQKMGFQ